MTMRKVPDIICQWQKLIGLSSSCEGHPCIAEYKETFCRITTECNGPRTAGLFLSKTESKRMVKKVRWINHEFAGAFRGRVIVMISAMSEIPRKIQKLT